MAAVAGDELRNSLLQEVQNLTKVIADDDDDDEGPSPSPAPTAAGTVGASPASAVSPATKPTPSTQRPDDDDDDDDDDEDDVSDHAIEEAEAEEERSRGEGDDDDDDDPSEVGENCVEAGGADARTATSSPRTTSRTRPGTKADSERRPSLLERLSSGNLDTSPAGGQHRSVSPVNNLNLTILGASASTSRYPTLSPSQRVYERDRFKRSASEEKRHAKAAIAGKKRWLERDRSKPKVQKPKPKEKPRPKGEPLSFVESLAAKRRALMACRMEAERMRTARLAGPDDSEARDNVRLVYAGPQEWCRELRGSDLEVDRRRRAKTPPPGSSVTPPPRVASLQRFKPSISKAYPTLANSEKNGEKGDPDSPKGVRFAVSESSGKDKQEQKQEQALQSFRTWLEGRIGSYARAWRLWLDPTWIGHIGVTQFSAQCRKHGYTENLRSLCCALDRENKGFITLSDLDLHTGMSLGKFFGRLVDRADLANLPPLQAGHRPEDAVAQAMLRCLDYDGTGRISKVEFMRTVALLNLAPDLDMQDLFSMLCRSSAAGFADTRTALIAKEEIEWLLKMGPKLGPTVTKIIEDDRKERSWDKASKMKSEGKGGPGLPAGHIRRIWDDVPSVFQRLFDDADIRQEAWEASWNAKDPPHPKDVQEQAKLTSQLLYKDALRRKEARTAIEEQENPYIKKVDRPLDAERLKLLAKPKEPHEPEPEQESKEAQNGKGKAKATGKSKEESAEPRVIDRANLLKLVREKSKWMKKRELAQEKQEQDEMKELEEAKTSISQHIEDQARSARRFSLQERWRNFFLKVHLISSLVVEPNAKTSDLWLSTACGLLDHAKAAAAAAATTQKPKWMTMKARINYLNRWWHRQHGWGSTLEELLPNLKPSLPKHELQDSGNMQVQMLKQAAKSVVEQRPYSGGYPVHQCSVDHSPANSVGRQPSWKESPLDRYPVHDCRDCSPRGEALAAASEALASARRRAEGGRADIALNLQGKPARSPRSRESSPRLRGHSPSTSAYDATIPYKRRLWAVSPESMQHPSTGGKEATVANFAAQMAPMERPLQAPRSPKLPETHPAYLEVPFYPPDESLPPGYRHDAYSGDPPPTYLTAGNSWTSDQPRLAKARSTTPRIKPIAAGRALAPTELPTRIRARTPPPAAPAPSKALPPTERTRTPPRPLQRTWQDDPFASF